MIRSKIISLSNTYHYYFILFFLVLLAKRNSIFIFLASIYLIYMFNKMDKKILLITIFLSLLSLSFLCFKKIPSSIDSKVLVTRVEKKENYYQVEIYHNLLKYTFTTNQEIMIGDILDIEATTTKFKKATSKKGFNAYEFYLGNNIHGRLKIIRISKANHLYTPRGLFEKLTFNLSYQTKSYFHAFFFGEKGMLTDSLLENNKREFFSLLGISLIHIYGIKKIFSKLFFYLDLKNSTQRKLLLLIDVFFVLMLNFSFLAMRIIINTILTTINKKRYLNLSNLDIKSLSFLVLLAFNSYLIYNQGFLLSLIIIFMLDLTTDIYHGDSFLIKEIKVNTLIFLFGIPFIVNFTNSLSPFTIFLIILIKPIIKYSIYPLLFITILFPVVDNLAIKYFNLFEEVLNYLSFYSPSFLVPSFETFTILAYYAILIGFFLINKRFLKLMYPIMGSIIIIFSTFLLDNKENKITFLDVGQGDATIISYNNKTIVIDAYYGCYQYLIKNGFYKIDLLILTHSDIDHIKDANTIINNLEVKNIVGNPYDDYGLTDKIIKKKEGDSIDFSDLKIIFYGPVMEYKERNNNSLVFRVILPGVSILFPGDMEDEAEKDILSRQNENLKSDIYKITHHGSSTSNMDLFMGLVKPEIVIISVGSNNRYNLPNQEIIRYLRQKNIRFYRTDHHGSIEYYIKDKRVFTYM
ncbi:ComEC/Rec2 family competence protein [Acholeplasma sp. OttesenSCG-928-E16]|nr:ComEC/Rec2 family competence protein [Acholeplasma sp. OttesenSCG-928-E16]